MQRQFVLQIPSAEKVRKRTSGLSAFFSLRKASISNTFLHAGFLKQYTQAMIYPFLILMGLSDDICLLHVRFETCWTRLLALPTSVLHLK